MANDVLDWTAALDAGPAVCGGKGHNLARLHRYGFRVPRGGVVAADLYRRLVAGLPALPQKTVAGAAADQATDAQILAALEEVRLAFETRDCLAVIEATIAPFLRDAGLIWSNLAVRSSATAEDSARASFAGIHQSRLNVRGQTDVARAVATCYGSLWTPQALAYRRRMGYRDEEVLCAVVLCEMVAAAGTDGPRAAGVGFTADPLTGRRDLLTIEAGAGLGEAVVSGRIDPQRIVYRVVKDRLVAHERRAGPPLLPPAAERELAETMLRVHWALGEGQDPQDVEWAFDGERMWLVQARPATRLRRPVPDGLAALPRYWSTANIKDAVPGVVCTLSWSLLRAIVEELAFAGAIAAGYPLPPGVELVRRIRGRGYFELTFMQWVAHDALGASPAEFAQAVGGHQPEIEVSSGTRAEQWRRSMARLRLVRTLWKVAEKLEVEVQRQDAVLRPMRALNFAELSRPELGDIVERLQRVHDRLDPAVGLANMASGPWEIALTGVLKPLFGDRARAVMGRLLAGTGAVSSAEHGYAVLHLANIARNDPEAMAWLASRQPGTTWTRLGVTSPFREELDRFLDRYGHRAVYEADMLNPRWAEDPSYVIDQVRLALADGAAFAVRGNAERISREAEAEVRARSRLRAPLVMWLARRMRAAMAAREHAKSALVASALPTRRLALEIGRRLAFEGHLDRPEDALDLSLADLACWLHGWWDGSGAKALAGDRARQRQAWLSEDDPPDVVTEGAPAVPRFSQSQIPNPQSLSPDAHVPASGAGREWSGIAAAPGVARGAARVVRHPHESDHFKSGEVLVAPSTDPGWTPLFLRASAIVMETGGYLSHGAIVAREFGIPAVVNIPGVLREIADGDVLTVDGDSGRLTRS